MFLDLNKDFSTITNENELSGNDGYYPWEKLKIKFFKKNLAFSSKKQTQSIMSY